MRRFALLALALLFASLALRPALADPGPSGQGNPFTVTEKVDASGSSSSEAYGKAIEQGRRKAWTELVHRVARQEAWPQLTGIADPMLQRLVRNYEVANEKRSTTRYVADVTYIFNEGLVRRFLRANNVAYSATAAPPMLLIPMAPGYDPDSAWTKAWAGNRMANGVVPLVLPAADPLNKEALAPLDFATATWSDVQPVASRAHAAQAVLVQAGPAKQGHISVGIRILSPALPQNLQPIDVPLPPNASQEQAYAAAVQGAANAIGEAWKQRNAIDFSKRSTLTANVIIPSLAEWGGMQQRLEKVPVVTDVKVAAMAIGQAQIVIAYAGTPAQLGDFLAQAGFDLSNRDGDWWLGAQPGAGPQAAP